MNLRPPSLTALSLLALTACGDSLVGGDWMEELLGLEEIPAEAAWELRWYGGPGNGLVVECDLREPWTGMHALDEVVFGSTEVPPPEVFEIPEEEFRIEAEEYSWGIALLVLAEPGPYWDVDPERERTDLDEDRGIWGVVREYAVLVADGDLDRLSMELLGEPDEGGVILPGAQFVGFMPEVILGTGAFNGSFFALPDEQKDWLWEPGIPVVHLEYMEEFLWEVFEGEILGGAHRHPCGDE